MSGRELVETIQVTVVMRLGDDRAHRTLERRLAALAWSKELKKPCRSCRA